MREPLRAKEIVVVAVAACVMIAIYAAKFLTCIEPDIVFVLPEAFEGAFVIVEDLAGTELRCIRGVYTVDVPPSRVVRVISFEPFERMHKEFIDMAAGNGTRIRSLVNLVPGDQEGALRCLGTGGGSLGGKELRTRVKYFLGTAAAARECDFFAIPVD